MVNMLKVLAGLAASAQAVQMPSTSFLAKSSTGHEDKAQAVAVAAHSQQRAQHGIEGAVDMLTKSPKGLALSAVAGAGAAYGLNHVLEPMTKQTPKKGNEPAKDGALKMFGCADKDCGGHQINFLFLFIGFFLGFIVANILGKKFLGC